MGTYEKKYKEALERARNLHKDAIDMDENIRAKQCEIIFPELQEPEDERIKKTLINFFSKGAEYDSSTNGIKDRNIIAWLEKQGEQSSLNINRECLKGIKRVQEYQDLSDWEKEFDKIASMYAHNKNQEGYNDSWYVKERAAEMLYYAKKELENQGGQKPAWSEEDEKMIGRIRGIIEAYAFSQSAVDVNGGLCEKEYIEADNWLNSLKERIGE